MGQSDAADVEKIICAACCAASDRQAQLCGACGQSPLLRGMYRLDAIIGRGASGITYRATRVTDGHSVAIKELPFHRIDSHKSIDLFEREARVLGELQHPGIPKYFDHFTSGTGKSLSFYLVQELIDGQNLAEEQQGRRYREDDVWAIVEKLLPILAYLHGCSPPIIHRDIKPSNVMRRSSDELVLIDFGSVRDAIKDAEVGGSTVAGTFGYMASEQYRGIATPATDIYGLGVLAVALLCRRTPETLIGEGNVLQWEQHVSLSRGGLALLRRMLAVDPSVRESDATRLLVRVQQLRRGLAAPAPSNASAFAETHSGVRAPTPPSIHSPALEHARTRTEPLRQDSSALGVGVGVILFVWLVAFLASKSPESPDPAARQCADGPCQPIPLGLGAFRFGMSFSETLAASVDSDTQTDTSVWTTRLWAWDAQCDLSFAHEETLSKMECTIAFEDEAKCEAARRYILSEFVNTYGKSSGGRWHDAGASLAVSSSTIPHRYVVGVVKGLESEPRCRIVLTNTSTGHQRAINALERAERDRKARRVREAEQEIQREVERLR